MLKAGRRRRDAADAVKRQGYRGGGVGRPTRTPSTRSSPEPGAQTVWSQCYIFLEFMHAGGGHSRNGDEVCGHMKAQSHVEAGVHACVLVLMVLVIWFAQEMSPAIEFPLHSLALAGVSW